MKPTKFDNIINTILDLKEGWTIFRYATIADAEMENANGHLLYSVDGDGNSIPVYWKTERDALAFVRQGQAVGMNPATNRPLRMNQYGLLYYVMTGVCCKDDDWFEGGIGSVKYSDDGFKIEVDVKTGTMVNQVIELSALEACKYPYMGDWCWGNNHMVGINGQCGASIYLRNTKNPNAGMRELSLEPMNFSVTQ